ncbi:MAG: hypothetical protein K2Q26_09585 [Bdellovibrionales bacterium]|nr:hypothetical protein [Bdellovibrionales bacterium]
MQSGQYDQAEAILKEQVDTRKGDRLAYLLEYATVLYQAQKFEESSKKFNEADQSAEVNDYTSLSREFGSIMMREDLVQFKTESFEFLLINVYQALNYLMLDNFENAMVMARRINDKINKIELDSDTKKRQLSFAAYLAGLLWDAEGEKDSAYIMYSKALEGSDFPAIQRDTLVAAKVSRREETYDRLKKKWPEIDGSIDWNGIRNKGELVVLLQQGWIPRKSPRPDNHRMPMLVPVPSQIRHVRIEISGKGSVTSQIVYDLESVAIQTLNEDYKRLVAKKVAGLAGKLVLREAVNRKNQGLGDLAFLALDAMDQADVRQWSTLPATFQVARKYLPDGKYTVKMFPADQQSGEPIWTKEIQIKKNKKLFIPTRVF